MSKESKTEEFEGAKTDIAVFFSLFLEKCQVKVIYNGVDMA